MSLLKKKLWHIWLLLRENSNWTCGSSSHSSFPFFLLLTGTQVNSLPWPSWPWVMEGGQNQRACFPPDPPDLHVVAMASHASGHLKAKCDQSWRKRSPCPKASLRRRTSGSQKEPFQTNSMEKHFYWVRPLRFGGFSLNS